MTSRTPKPGFFRLIPYSPVQLTTFDARASRRQFTRPIVMRPDAFEGQSKSPPHAREAQALDKGPDAARCAGGRRKIMPMATCHRQISRKGVDNNRQIAQIAPYEQDKAPRDATHRQLRGRRRPFHRRPVPI